MWQKIGSHSHVVTKNIISKDVDGPAAGVSDWVENMSIDLSKIKYEVSDMKMKKGVQKKVSAEDRFMMASLQPACHTKKIRNEYYLIVETSYDGCVCCVDLPDARMPMSIVPLINPMCFGYIPVAGYMPTELGAFHVLPSSEAFSD